MHDRLLKEGLLWVLARDKVRAFEFPTGGDPAALAGSERFIVISGQLPGGGLNLPFITSVKARHPQSLVVLLVDECPIDRRRAAEKLGVAGVLLKSISSDTFVASLRLVALGENVFSAPRTGAEAPSPFLDQDAFRHAGASADVDRPRMPLVALTEIEVKILACLAAGEPNGVIARRFGLTKGAMKAGLAVILMKTKATSRSQAALWALHDMDCSELALRIRAATSQNG